MEQKEHDNEMILKFTETITHNWSHIIEIRIFGAIKTYERFGKTQKTFKKQGMMGYFDNGQSIVEALKGIEADAIYYTINPVKKSLIARAKNKLIESYGKPTTADKNILKKKWILIDIDPIRETGIPSTNEQHQHAHKKIEEVWKYLHSEGWENPILVDSGNGVHAYYSVDLTRDDDRVIEQLLKTLADRFDDDVVKVDTGVFNPSRISRLPGTMNRKGSDCPDEGMPHRRCKAVWYPDNKIKTTHIDKIKKTGNWQPSENQEVDTTEQSKTKNEQKDYKSNETQAFNLEKWLTKHKIGYRDGGVKDGYHIYRLDKCPFEDDHHGTQPSILKFSDTSYGYKCFGERCSSKTWKDLRVRFDGQWSNEDIFEVENSESEPLDNWTSNWDSRPTRLTLPKAMELQDDMVPELIWDFSEEVADKINTHKEYVAVSMLAAISSTIGRKFHMRMTDSFKAWGNNFHILLGNSSQNKSSPMEITMDPIIKLDALEAKKFYKAIKEYNDKLETQEEEIEEINERIKILEIKQANHNIEMKLQANDITSEDIDELKKEIEEISNLQEPKQKYCYIDDASESALNNALIDNPNGILFYNDECASLFDSFSQKYNNNLKNFLLKSWTGNKPHRVIRGATSGKDKKILYIPAALVSILGSIQPDVFKKFLEQRLNITSGFAHRFQLCVMPEEPEDTYELDEQPIDKKLAKRYYEVIEKLYNYPELIENGGIVSRWIRFSDEAQVEWKDYHERLVNWTRSKSLPEIYKSHFKKYDYLMPGLCLNYHLIENPIDTVEQYQGEVSVENVRRAIRMTEFLATHAMKIFSITDIELSENKTLIELLKKIKEMTSVGSLTVRELKKSTRARIYGEVDKNLETLETMGWIRYRTTQTKRIFVEINPLYDDYYPDDNFKVESQEVLFRDFWN